MTDYELLEVHGIIYDGADPITGQHMFCAIINNGTDIARCASREQCRFDAFDSAIDYFDEFDVLV